MLWIRIPINLCLLDPDPHWECGPGSDPGGKKWPKKVREKNSNAECSLLRDEDFSCSLDVPTGGLGISKLQFLIKKCKFFCRYFWSLQSWVRAGSALTKNAGYRSAWKPKDPQHWKNISNSCRSKVMIKLNDADTKRLSNGFWYVGWLMQVKMQKTWMCGWEWRVDLVSPAPLTQLTAHHVVLHQAAFNSELGTRNRIRIYESEVRIWILP